MRWIFVLGLVGLIGCVPTVEQGPVTRPAPQQAAAQPPATPTRAKVQQFLTVVQRVEPIAERECRARAPRSNCDFRIVVDDRPGQPVNAYQTLDRSGRPILAFTLPMIASVRNADELAFVMGHEAAHHIAESYFSSEWPMTLLETKDLINLQGLLIKESHPPIGVGF